ncbi:MAG: FAD-dependent monooxygenase [Hyphomonas sp.]
MQILIAGGGIGGLTAALAFLKAGHCVTVLEQAREIAEVGAGLQISPNGMKVLDALGASARVARDAFRPRAQELRLGRSGARIFSIPLREASQARWRGEYLHIHRADLVEALKACVVDRVPDTIRLGARVTGYEHRETGVSAILSTGETVVGDLLIGADGIHSAVRAQMLGPDKPRYTGNVAWRAVVPVNKLGDYPPPETACVWAGKRRHAVTYRLRRGSLANFVGVVESPDKGDESWTSVGAREQALKDFKGWNPVIQRIIDEAPLLMRWSLYDRPELTKWHDGRVVLMGDACHPMLPFMAQGAVMAIEDAYVLARELGRREPVESALQTYERKRKPRTTRVQNVARENAALFHRSNPFYQLGTYGPMWMAGKYLPSIVHGRHDWLYGLDVTEPD